MHNLIHGEGDPQLGPTEKALYDEVSRANAAEFREHLKPDDILIIHDPQPLGAGALLKKELKLHAIWRCHIGLNEHNAATGAAWEFLKPYAREFDHAVFSAPEYIPDFLADRAIVIHPHIDPLCHKNRELHPHKLTGILCNSGLSEPNAPILTSPVMGTSACGLRQQIRDGVDGRLVNDPEDPDEISAILDEMLQHPQSLERWGRSAQLRVHNEFLIFTQLCRWLRLLAALTSH